MKKWFKWIISGVLGIAICYLSILLLFVLPTNERDNNAPAMQESMIRATLEWGRLAPFPATIENFFIKTEGNIFTRSFRGGFNAPKEVIDSWVEKSPGLKDAKIETMPDGKKRYQISPGGGAQSAEAIIDYQQNRVDFYVAWS